MKNGLKFVDLAQVHLSSSMHRSIGTTQFHLFFGTNARIRDDLEIRKILEKECIENIQCDQNKLRKNAKNVF